MAKGIKSANNTANGTLAFTMPLLPFDRKRSTITLPDDLVDGEYNLTITEQPKPSSNKQRPALVAKPTYESKNGKVFGTTILMLSYLLTHLTPAELEDDNALIATGHVGKNADGTLDWLVRPHYTLTKIGKEVKVV